MNAHDFISSSAVEDEGIAASDTDIPDAYSRAVMPVSRRHAHVAGIDNVSGAMINAL